MVGFLPRWLFFWSQAQVLSLEISSFLIHCSWYWCAKRLVTVNGMENSKVNDLWWGFHGVEDRIAWPENTTSHFWVARGCKKGRPLWIHYHLDVLTGHQIPSQVLIHNSAVNNVTGGPKCLLFSILALHNSGCCLRENSMSRGCFFPLESFRAWVVLTSPELGGFRRKIVLTAKGKSFVVVGSGHDSRLTWKHHLWKLNAFGNRTKDSEVPSLFTRWALQLCPPSSKSRCKATNCQKN